MVYRELHHDFKLFVDIKTYANILRNSYELSCILKLQLVAENFLEVFIDEITPSEKKVFFKRHQRYFDSKLALAIALGLPSEFGHSFKYLNQLRNDFGHKLDKKLEQNDLDQFVRLVESFDPIKPGEYIGSGDIKSLKLIVGTKIKSIETSLIDGFVITTYCFIMRASAWFVNELNGKGLLRVGKELKIEAQN